MGFGVCNSRDQLGVCSPRKGADHSNASIPRSSMCSPRKGADCCSSSNPMQWTSASDLEHRLDVAACARTLWSLVVHPRYHHTLPRQPDPPQWMEEVPQEVLMLIARSIKDAPSLLQLSRVNKRCRDICCDENLWRELCIDKFGAPPYSTNDSAFTWKELYRFNHELLYKCILAQAAESLGHMGMRSTAAAGPISLRLQGGY